MTSHSSSHHSIIVIIRTLVLPPWISYSPGGGGVSLLPWDSLFDLELVSSFHSVITMETFMKTIAPTEWPEEERTSFCYSARLTPIGQ